MIARRSVLGRVDFRCAALRRPSGVRDQITPPRRARRRFAPPPIKSRHYQIARSEWEIGLYFDDVTGPYLPTANLRGVLVEGAKFSKMGANVKRATIVESDQATLVYDGPRTLAGMWDSGKFRDIRAVVVGGARVMRCRPTFRPPWSIEFSLLFDAEVITREQLITAAETGGRLVGLGDFRPANGGPFGRFSVETTA